MKNLFNTLRMCLKSSWATYWLHQYKKEDAFVFTVQNTHVHLLCVSGQRHEPRHNKELYKGISATATMYASEPFDGAHFQCQITTYSELQTTETCLFAFFLLHNSCASVSCFQSSNQSGESNEILYV